MADTVTNQSLYSPGSSRRVVLHLTGISDGTGESAVTKFNLANFTDTNGVAPTVVKICSARWNVQGYSYIKLTCDHTSATTLMVLTQNGYDNFEEWGFLKDPGSAGGTGNLLLTSVGAAAGASYDITLELML
jgi:hypothetical protein